MISHEDFLSLLEKYVAGTISVQEHNALFNCINSEQYDKIVMNHIEGKFKSSLPGTESLPPYRSEEIIRRILSAEQQMSLLIPKKTSKTRVMYWSAAAVFIGVMALLVYFSFDSGIILKEGGAYYKSAEPFFDTRKVAERVNDTKDPLTVEMEDGSVIVLKPGSSLKYPRHFQPARREVYLEGEAFFQISKNVKRPFFVYNKNIVTHVLGTSFTIKADNKNKQLEVSVRSGKVEVYEKKTKESAQNNGVILLPNQKVVYHQETRQFIASLVDTPLPLLKENESKDDSTSAYEDVPLLNVLTSLEDAYGIEMIVENENLYNCLFTGDISKQNLYKKLDLICRTVDGSYELVGTKIMIRGKGCD
jgi:hypothetical protein